MAPTIFQPLWIDASGAGGILTLLVGFVCGDRVRDGPRLVVFCAFSMSCHCYIKGRCLYGIRRVVDKLQYMN